MLKTLWAGCTLSLLSDSNADMTDIINQVSRFIAICYRQPKCTFFLKQDRSCGQKKLEEVSHQFQVCVPCL